MNGDQLSPDVLLGHRACHSPLVHVVLGVVEPHPDLDGVALADPVEDVLHVGFVVVSGVKLDGIRASWASFPGS